MRQFFNGASKAATVVALLVFTVMYLWLFLYPWWLFR